MKVRPELQRHFGQLAQRVFNVPLMIEETKAEVIAIALQQRLGIVSFERIDGTVLGAAEINAMSGDAYRKARGDKLFHVDDDIAVIPIDGTLVHKFGYLDPISGMTGYDGIARKLRAALNDQEIRAIWFDIDSPGGEVSGLFALVREIALSTRSETGGKPIWAFCNEQACSAAYAIASVCDRVYAPRDAVVGSIGAVVMHVDYSQMLSEAGVKVTMIRSAPRKARMGPYEPLDEESVTKLQAWVDETGREFAEMVAMGRGISVKAALDTEADWFTGEEGKALGLVDDVMDEREAWELLRQEIQQP